MNLFQFAEKLSKGHKEFIIFRWSKNEKLCLLYTNMYFFIRFVIKDQIVTHKSIYALIKACNMGINPDRQITAALWVTRSKFLFVLE
jgi:hypothetical protein